jgi:hypothetical protein
VPIRGGKCAEFFDTKMAAEDVERQPVRGRLDDPTQAQAASQRVYERVPVQTFVHAVLAGKVVGTRALETAKTTHDMELVVRKLDWKPERCIVEAVAAPIAVN